jgi:heme-degrading monooxygenase HmoA
MPSTNNNNNTNNNDIGPDSATSSAADGHSNGAHGDKDLIADTPTPPYYAVIFTSLRTSSGSSSGSSDTDHHDEYSQTAKRMVELAKQQPGYLGVESARDGVGITVSYWKDTASIRKWKQHAEHLEAQEKGKNKWYTVFKTRVALVERDYGSSAWE